MTGKRGFREARAARGTSGTYLLDFPAHVLGFFTAATEMALGAAREQNQKIMSA